MILPIEINSDDIISQYDVSREQLNSMFDNIAKSLGVIYLGKLEEVASQELHSTRSRYLRNIRLIDSGKLQSTVLLDYSKDKLIKMIEEGSGPFDMKPKLLASAKVKVTSTGKKYISIPFRASTPDAEGESELFAFKMPSEIYAIVKKKEVFDRGPLKASSSKPLTISEMDGVPAHLKVIGKRKEIKDSSGKALFKEYEHKSTVYEGITKQTDKVTGQSTYHSFRRVSDNSDPNAFIHPGFTAKKLMDKALGRMNIEEELQTQIDNELAKLGF